MREKLVKLYQLYSCKCTSGYCFAMSHNYPRGDSHSYSPQPTTFPLHPLQRQIKYVSLLNDS